MDAFNAEALSLLGVGLAVTGLRAGVRIWSVGIRRLSPDDSLIAVASAAYIVETALACCAQNSANGLTNSFMADNERSQLQPSSREYGLRELGSKLQLGSWVSSSVVLWSTKAAICTLYLRLANRHHRGYRLPAYIGLGVIAASWLAASLTLVLSCRPLPLMWQIYPNPGAQCQPASSPPLAWTYTSLDLVTSGFLMALPVSMLFRWALPLWQKVITVMLLGCGLFVAAAAILRAVVASTSTDARLSWALRESFAALLTANMAILLPAVAHWASSRRCSSNSMVSQSEFEKGHPANLPGNDSEETIVATLYVHDKRDSDPPPTPGSESERRIQRRIDVCVVAEDEGTPVRSGNYTGVWSGEGDDRPVPLTRSRYFGDDIPQRAHGGT